MQQHFEIDSNQQLRQKLHEIARKASDNPVRDTLALSAIYEPLPIPDAIYEVPK